MTKLALTIDDQTFQVEIDVYPHGESSLKVKVDGKLIEVQLPGPDSQPEGIEWLVVEGRPYEIQYDHELHWIKAYNGIHHVEVRDSETLGRLSLNGDGRVKAPIPGQISRILVEMGETVQAGQPLLVLEAMKMENIIYAPRTGSINAIYAILGKNVRRDEILMEIL